MGDRRQAIGFIACVHERRHVVPFDASFRRCPPPSQREENISCATRGVPVWVPATTFTEVVGKKSSVPDSCPTNRQPHPGNWCFKRRGGSACQVRSARLRIRSPEHGAGPVLSVLNGVPVKPVTAGHKPPDLSCGLSFLAREPTSVQNKRNVVGRVECVGSFVASGNNCARQIASFREIAGFTADENLPKATVVGC